MAKRAAICIGVDHAGTMPPLQAAAKGAGEVGVWARSQGCDTTLLVDDAGVKVSAGDIFDAVKACVEARTYEQLIIYFSGHGVLTAPGAEYWLLSRAPENPNEAVNLFRSIEDARNSGIPHVVFVSDACRSSATGPPLSGVTGGTIFPNVGYGPTRAEVDVFYATRPGDPAWEVAKEQATKHYRGIFTDFLLTAVKTPERVLVDEVSAGPTSVAVVTSRKLKPHLEAAVPAGAADLDVRIRQTPEVRVESALPKYFALVDPATIQQPRRALAGRPVTPPALDTALTALSATHFQEGAAPSTARDASLAARLGLTAEVERLAGARGRGHFETRTGFTVHGAHPVTVDANGWRADPEFADPQDASAWHVRLHPGADPSAPASVVLALRSPEGVTTGTVLAVLPDFIGTVVVDGTGRVTAVNYVPSDNSTRYATYQRRATQMEGMKAFAAVAARHGRFVVEGERAADFAARIRQDKGLDPVLGLYAAYAYAQAGQYDDVLSVFTYMREDDFETPIPFDVVMLATRYHANEHQAQRARHAPFAPMLSQGWALLAPGDPMFHPIHARLRPHLVPSLWTTLDEAGLEFARMYVRSGEVP